MHPLFKVLIVAAVLAIIAVIYQSQQHADDQSGWSQYGVAEAQGFTVEALEAAQDQTHGTSAEPWIAYQLAVKLYESGGRANLDRSLQLAKETLRLFPDHPVAERLRNLIQMTDSYAGVADAA